MYLYQISSDLTCTSSWGSSCVFFSLYFCAIILATVALIEKLLLIIPRACAKGKVIGFVCRRHENRQLSRSRAPRKPNKFVEIGGKLASVRFGSFGTAHERHIKNVIVRFVATPIERAYCRPCVVCSRAQEAPAVPSLLFSMHYSCIAFYTCRYWPW